jgi:ankyrin repeat protein
VSAHPAYPNGSKTALMSAAEAGSAAKVAALIDDGKADVGFKNEHGLTALHFASTPEAARALVERGADVGALAKELSWTQPSASPLIVAMRRSAPSARSRRSCAGAALRSRTSRQRERRGRRRP